nr:hypothetical protein [Tanacetum cinerariifolium]
MKKGGRGFGVMLVSWLVGCGGFVVVGMVFVSGLVVSKVVEGEISATGDRRRSEAILHGVNRLIDDRKNDVGLSMLLVDFKNAFNLVDREVMLKNVRRRCPVISRWVEFHYSNLARLYYGEHTLCSCQGVQQGDPLGPLLFALVLHPLICKIRNSFSLSLQAWYPDDGTIVGDTLVVGKVLEVILKDGPRYGLHLNVKVFWPKEDPRSRLEDVFSPNIARPLYGVKLLERIVIASGPGFGDWQWRLVTLPFVFGGLDVYSTVAHGPNFDDALCVFNAKMKSGLLSNHGVIGGSDFWFGADYERVFTGYIYGDHAVSCVGIIDIKHRHNVVRDTLVDICLRLWISAGKEVDIGLGGGRDKPLHPPDMLLYSGHCAHRKRVKYEAKCANIGYGFLPFSFSFFGKLEKDAVTLLNRIRKFFVAQDIGHGAAVYIFTRISFAIARRVEFQIASRLPTNFL